MSWNYEAVENVFEKVPVGRMKLRIKDVEKKQSKNGNEMLEFTFEVSGSTATLKHWIVFLPDHAEITNRQLTQFFDSFDIKRGDFTLANWKGKIGACETKEDGDYIKVRYFLQGKQKEELTWVEPSAVANMTPVEDDGTLPF